MNRLPDDVDYHGSLDTYAPRCNRSNETVNWKFTLIKSVHYHGRGTYHPGT